jgi:carbon monoxide dehydrogenase subunit G
MHLSGQTEIAAGRQRVWDTVTDPRQVAACVPGQPKVEVVDDRRMKVTAVVGNGFLRTTVVVDIRLTDLQAPAHATAAATCVVMGGPVKADGSVDLTELPAGRTQVTWSADVTIGGFLARFAAMSEEPVRGGVDQTLACLRIKIEAAEAAEGAGEGEPAGARETPVPGEAGDSPG